MQAVLRVEGLDYNVGTFSLRLPGASLLPGDRVAICGPSGCGKSTLLGLLALALAPGCAVLLELGGVDAAALWLCGRKDKLTALRRSLIGFVPQTGGLLPFLSIGENMRLQQDMIRGRDPARIAALAHSLGIAALMDRRPGEVSVGQRQRAAIGRALGHKPRLVLADEPTASLHPAQADDMLGLLALSADEGAAVLVATHDPARAREAGFRLIHARVDAERETTEFAFDADADPTA